MTDRALYLRSMRAHRVVELVDRFVIRAKVGQRERWEAAAAADHRNVSEWARLVLERAADVALVDVEPKSKIVTKAKKRA